MLKTIKIISLVLVIVLLLSSITIILRNMTIKRTSEIKHYEIKELYNKIDIDTKVDDINIYLSDVNENKVVCTEYKGIKFDVKVVDGTLSIKQIDSRTFFDHMFNFKTYKVDIYLSIQIIESLNINSTTGKITVNEGFTFMNVDIDSTTGDVKLLSNVTGSVNIEATTGDVEVKNINKLGNMEIETSTGDITLQNINCGSLKIDVTTGKTKLSNVIATNDINIEGTTGDITFDGIDANNICIDVTTGDVKGTILSSKFFIAKSTTGDINVPETRDGGVCRITVTTGDINISYK